MTPNDFINKFYTDNNYKKKLIKKIATKSSVYDIDDLDKHKEDMSIFYHNILFDKISSEIYITNKELKLKDIM